MKTFYEDVDFEKMSFHDASIWGFALGGRKSNDTPFADISFDIDYIFEWIENEDCLSFKVAPSTLVFKNAWNLKIDFDTLGHSLDPIQIAEIKRQKSDSGLYKYEIFLNTFGGKGVISFEAATAEMTVRKLPTISISQALNRSERS